MSKTRFTPWVVLACIGTLAGCTSGEDGTVGNTELNVVLPNGCDENQNGSPTAPDCYDIQIVEYTIACDDGDNTPNGPFLDNGAGFDDRVTISGVLEVFDEPQPGREGRATSGDPWTWGKDLGAIYVAQGVMDLPVTQKCTAQLRARTEPTVPNPNGEVICTDTVTFEVQADTVSTVNVLMICGLSFQADVAQLDLAADFSFNVSNFCPDLFILNCIDTDLNEQVTPLGVVVATACQTRFRDGDDSCGGTGIAATDPDGFSSCDPQVCTTAPEGLRCAPNPDFVDPEVMTTVTCTSALPFWGAIDCDGLPNELTPPDFDPTPDSECVFTGDTLGVIGGPAPSPPPAAGGTGAGPGGFFVSCALCTQAIIDSNGGVGIPGVCDDASQLGNPLAPGAQITCTAVTTDGDEDCDKTKDVPLTCPGLTPCQQYADAPFVCDDPGAPRSPDCVAGSCNDALAQGGSCGSADNDFCCEYTNTPNVSCDTGTAQPGLCDANGECQAQGCSTDDECPAADGNCLGASLCVGFVCQEQPPVNEGGACDNSGVGSGSGVCGDIGSADEGICVSNDGCLDSSTCADTDECNLGVCNTTPTPWVCIVDPNEADGDDCDCDGQGLNCLGICNGGACEIPPFITAGSGETHWRAMPKECTLGRLPNLSSTANPACEICLGGPPDDSDCPPECVIYECDGLTDPPGTDFDVVNLPAGAPAFIATTTPFAPYSCNAASDNPGEVCDINTTPDPCTNGACAVTESTQQPVRGCAVPSGTLKGMLAVDVFMDMVATSPGDGTIVLDYGISAINGSLAIAGGLANMLDINITTNFTTANPKTLNTGLQNQFKNTLMSNYITQGVLTLDDEFIEDPQDVIPTSTPNVIVNFSGQFLLELVINATGAPLNVDGASCDFDNPGGLCTGGTFADQNCDETIDPAVDGGAGDPVCIAGLPAGLCLPTGDPAFPATRTIGAEITLGVTQP